MVNEDEGKRAKWTNSEIAVDHPKRLEEGVRDPTVFTGGLTTSLTGMHCDVSVMDDIVVMENAYTEEGRSKVASQYSLLASIEGAEAKQWVVGTRYHPKDLYGHLLDMHMEIYDEEGEVIETEPVYEVFERQVEDHGDGTGQFLWPVQVRSDGMKFGFDRKILAKKRAQYIDRTQFRAQYYNDPNDPGEARIDRNKFQYFDGKFLNNNNGHWFYKENKLNIYAAVDFAYTTSKRADYTSIVVIGIDRYNSIYVLDIDRFKTGRISDYFDHIFALHSKWGFRKLAAEITAAQVAIVNQLKEMIRENGVYVSIAEIKHNKHEGTKQERMSATLEPRYDNQAVWHYRGGNIQILEEELAMTHPPHDDVMDALSTAIDIAVAPVGAHYSRSNITKISVHPRFGGVAAR
jgi:phage terminase large subunit-like protein